MTAPAQMPSEPKIQIGYYYQEWIDYARALRAHAESLQAECERLQRQIESQDVQMDAVRYRAEQAERKLAEAMAALRKYGRHKNNCKMRVFAESEWHICTCGFDEVTK